LTKHKGVVYRVGGDEFAILLPNHVADEAVVVAERVRRTVNGQPLTSRGLNIGLSMGVAEYPTHAKDGDALGGAADRAQYESKELGRNVVRSFGEPRPAAPAPREPERQQPQPGGFTEAETKAIRLRATPREPLR